MIGTLTLVVITVCLVAVVGVAATGWSISSPAPTVAFEGEAIADENRLVLTHVAGEAVSVESMTVHVTIAGEPLDHQPPVPFFAAHGFVSGPTGPFNERADTVWRSGQRASFALASTNDPSIAAGDEVVVRIAVEGQQIAVLELVATS